MVRQCVIEGKVVPLVVGHRHRSLPSVRFSGQMAVHPVIAGPSVPAVVSARPLVLDVVGALALVRCGRHGRIHPVRQQRVGETGGRGRLAVGLLEGADPSGSGAVVEATHPLVGPEVVVEGTILLDEDDDVTDIGQ